MGRLFASQSQFHIPTKAKVATFLVLMALSIIGLKVWYLAIAQHAKKHSEVFSFRKKVVIDVPPRGTIRDRFNHVLALNTLSYRLEIAYADMKDISLSIWDKKLKKKRFLRKEYIHRLAAFISKETNLGAERVEDMIHSHAALPDSVPLVLSSSLNEEQYYRLKAREKDFPGLRVVRVPKRSYPYGKTGSHVIGYVGQIALSDYERVLQKINELGNYLKQLDLGLDVAPPQEWAQMSPEEARQAYYELQEKAYSLHDLVGKGGVEEGFEEELRGFAGKQFYFCDAKNHLVHTLPFSSRSYSGKRLYLSLSIALQEYCEKLLAKSEEERARFLHEAHKPDQVRWIRGGAIVAMEPNTGEIVACASFPRFDPNDFVQGALAQNVHKWVENDRWVQKVWDRSFLLEKEVVTKNRREWDLEQKELDWDFFLRTVVAPSSPLVRLLDGNRPIGDLVAIEGSFDKLAKRLPQYSPKEIFDAVQDETFDQDGELQKSAQLLSDFFSDTDSLEQKLLTLDLARTVVSYEDFSPELFNICKDFSIEKWRTLSCQYAQLQSEMKEGLAKFFREGPFKKWRTLHEKEFLVQKRKEEKAAKRPHKPYLELLDEEEKRAFAAFWKRHKEQFAEKLLCDGAKKEEFSALAGELEVLPAHLRTSFLAALKGYQDLSYPLLGRYKSVDKTGGKALIASAIREMSCHPLRSFCYRELAPQGSIFKLVTSYSALKQKIEETGSLDRESCKLFEINDNPYEAHGEKFLGTFNDGRPIPQFYKGGRIPKSIHRDIGHLDLVRAIETSSNVYFSLLASEYLQTRKSLLDAAADFGFGEQSGMKMRGEATYPLPSDLEWNQTGLYATAIGQHTLITTPIRTSILMAAVGNGGKILTPKIASFLAGQRVPFGKFSSSDGRHFKFEKSLKTIGIDFPLFSLRAAQEKEPQVVPIQTHVKRQIFFPREIQEVLFEGMRRSNKRIDEDIATKGFFSSLDSTYWKAFENQKHTFVGKTSTAETEGVLSLAGDGKKPLYHHIWYGAIAFSDDAGRDAHLFSSTGKFGDAELVVVVFLPWGGFGKHAAPIAASVVQKWREIQQAASPGIF